MTLVMWIGVLTAVVAAMFTVILGLLGAIWGQNRKQLEALELRHTTCQKSSSDEHRRLHERVNVVENRVGQHDVAIARLESRWSDAE